jgi:hypothetical protein
LATICSGVNVSLAFPGSFLSSSLSVRLVQKSPVGSSVHPEFPKQRVTIAIELGKDGQRAIWALGESTNEASKLSVEQLSEYLLKPVLSSASINREQ